MKKLKVLLLALLATTLSVGLIACRKPKPDDTDKKPDDDQQQTTDTKTIDRMSFSDDTLSFSITDADTQDAFLTRVKSELVITVHYKGAANEKYDATDCDYDVSTVNFGEVGNYTVKVTPKSYNPNGNIWKNLDVYITHHFENDVCTVDGATRTSQTIDVGLEYKLFHTGDAVYTAADDVSKAAIRPFGSMMVDGREETVKTYTVGRLEKGMSITVKGTAETTYDELGVTNLYYFFPILGFADTSIGTYTGGAGTSVIVRNEGWVLLDGIGTPRLLAGKAAGGGGANDSGNYGSHPDDQGEKPEGYEAHGTGTPTLDKWKEWFTYSTGVTSNSDSYLDEQEVEFTWTYLNNGIIELVFKNNTANINLTARTKVPDSSKGYYDTILHGEYVRMKFTEITTIATTTLTGVSYEGVKSDARKIYLDNEIIKPSEVFSVNITTEQNKTPAPDTQFDIEANIGTTEAPEWVSLSTTPLDGAKMKAFRVIRTMGTVTKTADIDINNFITIKTNAVDRAVPYAVRYGEATFANNASIGEIKLETAVSGSDATAKLIVTGRANSFTNEQKAALEGVTAAKYIALRLWAREGATANFKGATPSVKSGNAAIAGVKAIVPDDGAYVDLIIPVDANVKANGVVVSGLVEGGVDVTIDLSGIESISVTSQVKKGTIALNKGGDVTVVYTMSAEEYENVTPASRVYVNGASARFNALNEEKEAGYDYTGTVGTTKVSVKKDDAAHTVTVKYTLPKCAIDSVEKFDLVLQDGKNNMLAQDTVYYDMEFEQVEGTATCDDFIHVEADGTTLYIMIAAELDDLQSAALTMPQLMLNMNDGTKEGVNPVDLGFYSNRGKLQFVTELPEGLVTTYVNVLGTIDNSDDTDNGIVIVLAVDVTKLGYEEAPYFFEVKMDSARDRVPESVLQVTQSGETTAIVSKPATAGAKEDLGEKGSCINKGYSGYKVTVDGKDFYAGVAVSGGTHDVENGVCVVCGATESAHVVKPGWYTADTIKNVGLQVGDFYEFIGEYQMSMDDYNGSLAVILEGSIDGKWGNYIVNENGYVYAVLGDWGADYGMPAHGTNGEIDYAEKTENNARSELYSSLITEEHQFNTVNGAPDTTGKAISPEDYKEAKLNGTIRYTISRTADLITVRVRLYRSGTPLSGTPYSDFYAQVHGYTGTINMVLQFRQGDTGAGQILKDDAVTMIKGKTDALGHTHDWDATDHCTVCGMLKPGHQHNYVNYKCICGDVEAHDHQWANGACTICGVKCLHETLGSGATCEICGIGKTTKDTKTWAAANYLTGFTDATPCAHTVEIGKGETVTYTIKIATNPASGAFMGLVTQIWDANGGTAKPYTRANELAFHQGNNYSLSGTWSGSNRTSKQGNINPLAGTKQLEDSALATKTGFTYKITVSFVENTVVVTYEAWTKDADLAQAAPYTGVCVYSNVSQTKIAIGVGPDGATLEGNITAVTSTYADAE